MGITVREFPPLRESYEIESPSGRIHRWGEDEPQAINVPSGVRYSSTMPGGDESFDATLPRKPGVDYSDLQRLSTILVRGACGQVVSETRLERAPRVSGEQMAITPSAVGWQAALEDDKPVHGPYISRDQGKWQSVSRSRRLTLLATWDKVFDPSNDSDREDGLPALVLTLTGPFPNQALCEAWLDGGTLGVGEIRADFESEKTVSSMELFLSVADDDKATNIDTSADHLDATNDSATGLSFVPSAARRWAAVRFRLPVASAVDQERTVTIRPVVIGGHGLDTVAGDGYDGLRHSDVIADALARWVPMLNFTTGPDGSIRPSDFPIPELAFDEPTSVAELNRQGNRFHLNDWAVWHPRTFHYHPRGEGARRWRARVGPSGLQEAGPSAERLWEAIRVQYQSEDGSTRTVGPPGSGADTEDATLKDSDPENPANQLGMPRRDTLVIGTSTPAAAIEVGRRFLEDSKALDQSGQATFVGAIEDDRGILRPYHEMKGGDEVEFIDAADSSYRRVVRAEHVREERACGVDLDAPPEGLDALLERLGAVLAPMGL